MCCPKRKHSSSGVTKVRVGALDRSSSARLAARWLVFLRVTHRRAPTCSEGRRDLPGFLWPKPQWLERVDTASPCKWASIQARCSLRSSPQYRSVLLPDRQKVAVQSQRRAPSVPLAAHETAEGNESDKRDDQAEQETPDEHD
jgi:hypothetical protein